MNTNATYCANPLHDCKMPYPLCGSVLLTCNSDVTHYGSVLQSHNLDNLLCRCIFHVRDLNYLLCGSVLQSENLNHPLCESIFSIQNLNHPRCERILRLRNSHSKYFIATAKRYASATTSIQPSQSNKHNLSLSNNVKDKMNYYEERQKTYGCGWQNFLLKMKSIRFARNCHASEASAVATRLVALYEGMEFPEDSYLRNAMSDFKDLAVRIDSAVDRKVRPAYDTEDTQRAQCLRSLYYLLRSAVASQDANVSAHAAVVYQTFRSCGLSVLHKGLDERTGHIDSLLTDLAANEVQPHIAAVPGLADSINQLDTAQQAFEVKRVDYQSRLGVMANADCATALKMKVVDMVNNTILPYFGTMTKVKGGVYSDFNDILCQVVASANASTKLHSRHKKIEVKQEPTYVAPTNEEGEPLTA